MIARLITAEVAGLRRSFVPWLAMLLVVGGSVVARMLAWVTHAIGRTELGTLPFVQPDVGWSDVAVPLALLAYLIVTSYVFGRDFEDGNIDLILTSPVRREAVVVARTLVIAAGVLVLCLMGWAADVATRAILATSPLDPGPATSATAALGSAMAAIATLPLVGGQPSGSAAFCLRSVWASRSRSLRSCSVGLRSCDRSRGSFRRRLPAGGSTSLLGVGLSALLFAGGLAATVRALRSVDLYE